MPICCFHDRSPDLYSTVFSNIRSFCVWACYCGYSDTICYRETYLLFKLSDHTSPHISAELIVWVWCAGCLGKRTSFTFLPGSPVVQGTKLPLTGVSAGLMQVCCWKAPKQTRPHLPKSSGRLQQSQNPITSSWWELPWSLRECKLTGAAAWSVPASRYCF